MKPICTTAPETDPGAVFSYLNSHQILTIVQIYVGAVKVNTRQANRIAGAAHSKCPDLR